MQRFLPGGRAKEAYIKALGTGLSLPLDEFVVSIDPQAAPSLISADDRPDEPSRWVFSGTWNRNPATSRLWWLREVAGRSGIIAGKSD